ncbi:unnamed protein product, partial [Tenebrio molitor]
PLSVDECRGTLCDFLFFLCSNCEIFGVFRITLDVVVVQSFWFELGMDREMSNPRKVPRKKQRPL